MQPSGKMLPSPRGRGAIHIMGKTPANITFASWFENVMRVELRNKESLGGKRVSGLFSYQYDEKVFCEGL